ncbi:MAG: AAA domain-containing protein [Thermoguttaceae bacterium]|jgi:hypothetical protein
MGLLCFEPISRQVGKSELLALIDQVGGLKRQRVGHIELRGGRAAIEVPDGWESRLAKLLDGQLLGGRRVRVWDGSAQLGPAGGDDHFGRLAELLDLESRAEARAAAERGRRLSPDQAEQSGNSLLDLVVADEEAGLGGRYLVELVKRKRTGLPWTRLDLGSPVVLSPQHHAQQSHRGVICQRSERSVRVALNDLPNDLGDHDAWRLDLSFDEVAIARQRIALERAAAAHGDRFAVLRDVLIGRRQPEFGLDPQIRPLDRSLNAVQREAVQFALGARDVGLIHGPPGTGKTTAVVELIRQAARRGRKILACAPSNLAVDNIFERLLAHGERVVRLGHPARVLPELRDHTLDLLVEQHRDVALARKLVKQALSLFREAGRHTRAAPKPGQRSQLRSDAKSLLADARKLEMQAVESILDSAQILCATTTGVADEVLGTRRFDLAVIDEACQSTEPGCWIPLLRCDRAVLAGDHCQLPPTVVSGEAAQQGFAVSLFERLMDLYGQQIARRLIVQYRMHAAIMEFSSRQFYDGQLQADASVAGHLLSDLWPAAKEPQRGAGCQLATGAADWQSGPHLCSSPAEFIDTAGAGFEEEEEPDGESRRNPREAELVCRKVRALLDCGLPPPAIGVITPYAAQVRLLRSQLDFPGLEIDSVDGFQGREKEAVVISLVRSNPRCEIGFLADVRRMNVALTRARRKLLVIGDSATLAAHPFYQAMIEYFESLGSYHTVWEEEY